MSFVVRIGFFAAGMYVGKYYPQYVPLPQFNQGTLDRVLTYLRELERRQAP